MSPGQSLALPSPRRVGRVGAFVMVTALVFLLLPVLAAQADDSTGSVGDADQVTITYVPRDSVPFDGGLLHGVHQCLSGTAWLGFGDVTAQAWTMNATSTIHNEPGYWELEFTVRTKPCAPIEYVAAVYDMPPDTWPQDMKGYKTFEVADAGTYTVRFDMICADQQFDVHQPPAPPVIDPLDPAKHHGTMIFGSFDPNKAGVQYRPRDCTPGDTVVVPQAPEVTQASCDVDGGVVDPSVVPAEDTDEVSYGLEGTVGAGETVTVTATPLGEGVVLDVTDAPGWVLDEESGVAKFTVELSTPECEQNAELVAPQAPEVTQASCDLDGGVVDPVLALATTPGVSYSVEGTVAAGATIRVIATPDEGGSFADELAEGWVAGEDGSASYTVTFDEVTCSPDEPAPAPEPRPDPEAPVVGGDAAGPATQGVGGANLPSAAAPASAAPAHGAAVLPRTGAPLLGLLAAAGALVMAGWAVMVISRRRGLD